MEEHVVSRISIKAVRRNYTCVRVCSWGAVGRYRAVCVWIKENSQSLGKNFKVKRKSRLIRCTLWAFYSAAFTTFGLCFHILDQARLPSSSWKKGERLIREKKRWKSSVQVLHLWTLRSLHQGLCVPQTWKHQVFAQMNTAFQPRILRVPVCKMSVGLTSKSKFVLVKKKAFFLLINFIQVVFFISEKSQMPCLLISCMAH